MNPSNDDLLVTDHSVENEPDLSILNAGTVILEPTNAPNVTANLDLISSLPDLNVSFKMVRDPVNQLISLKDIDKQLDKDGTMDVTRAEIVAESFTDFYDIVPKGGFTKVPTKANYRETRQFIKSEICKEEAQLIDTFKTYIENPFKAAVDTLTSIKETYLPGLIRISESLKSELYANKAKLSDNQNEDAQELMKLDLSKIETYVIKPKRCIMQSRAITEFKESIAAIQKVLKTNEAGLFFWQILTEKKEINEPTINISRLYEFIMAGNFMTLLNKTETDIDGWKIKVEKMVNEARGISDKPDKITEFVVRNANDFSEFHSSLTKYSSLIFNLTLLNLSIKQMVLAYIDL